MSETPKPHPYEPGADEDYCAECGHHVSASPAVASAVESELRQAVAEIDAHTFHPRVPDHALLLGRAADAVAALRGQVEALTAEHAKHEHCIEEIQANELLMAERENELHDEKDARIVVLTRERDEACRERDGWLAERSVFVLRRSSGEQTNRQL